MSISPWRALALCGLTTPLLSAPVASAQDSPAPSVQTPEAEALPASPTGENEAASLPTLGCTPTTRLTHLERTYVACGKAGVWVLAGGGAEGSAVLEQRHVVGEAKDLFVRGDEVWVESVERRVSPLAELALVSAPVASAGTPATSTVAVAASEARGRVLASEGSFITVSIGKAEGVKLGDRIEAYATDDEDEEAGGGVREETVLIGRVARVSEHQARVEVGFGELVAVGTAVRKTARQVTADMVAPARIGRVLTLEGSLRPFLPVDGGSFAVLGDLAATYLGEKPWFARAELHPLGAILGTGSDGVAFGALASAGYDQTYFAIGLGFGSIRTTREVYTEGFTPGVRADFELAVTQSVRLGARDGLNMTLRNGLRLSDGDWAFGWFDGQVQLPVGNGSWLTARGSGGDAPGYMLGEVGFRRLVRGNGADGSLFIRPTAGFAAIATRDDGYRSFQGGPMVGMHLEWRLGL